TILSIGDLSGDDASRCRAGLLGLELAVGRINAQGGLDGGRKVTVLGLDDRESASLARRLTARELVADHPLALAAPFGPASAAIDRGPAAVRALLDRDRTMALVIDGTDPEGLASRLAALGRTRLDFAPALILASSRLLSEDFVESSGALGRIGAIQGPSEVSP